MYRLILVLLMFFSVSVRAAVSTHFHSQKQMLAEASILSGVSVNTLATFAALESTFRHRVKNDRSTASGIMQITKGTWVWLTERYGAQYGITADTSRKDPLANTLMAAEYIKENRRYLRKRLGREPELVDLYNAHFLGPGRVPKLLEATPDTFISELFPNISPYNTASFTHKGVPITVKQYLNNIRTKIVRANIIYGDIAAAYKALYLRLLDAERYLVDNGWPNCKPKPSITIWPTVDLSQYTASTIVLEIIADGDLLPPRIPNPDIATVLELHYTDRRVA